MATWIWMELLAPDAICPPQLAGLFAALTGMIVGSLAPMGRRRGEAHAAAAHPSAHAAHGTQHAAHPAEKSDSHAPGTARS